MKTRLPPMGRANFPACNGDNLTPFGWWLARLAFRIRRNFPFVSMRRYLVVKLERDRLLHDLHMQAIRHNREIDLLKKRRKP